MKLYLPLITSLFLLSASCNPSVTQTNAETTARQTETITSEIKPHIKDNIAPEISVKISSAENGGSGVIIAQQDNKYLVLTNNHVLRSPTEFTISTHDGITHRATEVEKAIAGDDDLALLQFTSDKTYQTATINTAATPRVEQTILAIGYDAETGELVTETGTIERVPDKSFKQGYSIGYTSNIVQGMSGGAILNTDGEVIGINGKSAFPIVNTGYEGEDGTKPTREEIEQYRKLSWGLSINRLLAQINPEIITAYNLPLPETTDGVESPELTGWLGELEAKAKQITVRIDSSSGANGSGVIIAKEGNTYTVLTADHVLCEKDDDYKCIDYTYEIVAPDGNKHTLNANTVKAEAGVDLATFKFTSNESYQVAQLADYPIQNSDAVFVAGYSKPGENTPPQWQFSLGFGLNKEQGLLNVNSNSTDNENSAAISQISLSGGYEMVYTSPTYGGMSGGAVLDKNGNVIGIHGQAEGEATVDSQGGASNKIQMGYSLGIPINTFMGLKARLGAREISLAKNVPAGLNLSEQKALETAILETDIADSNATAKRWLERGNQLWRLKRHTEAVAAFDKAIELNEAEFNYLAHYGKGLVLISLEDLESAFISLEEANKVNPKFASAFYVKGMVLQELGQLDKALVEINAAILLEPNSPNWKNSKAILLLDLKRFKEAEVAFNKAINISPRAAFYVNRGNLYFRQRKLKLALADFNRAIQLNSSASKAYNSRGNVFYIQKKSELALSDYNQAIKINPSYVNGYNNRGVLYEEQGRLELALADYNQAIKINPEGAEAYTNRGVLYEEQGKLELALADYNQAIEINPESAKAYNNRGVLYAEQGRLELALADYKQAIEINPEDVNAYNNRGLFYKKQGRLKLALSDYNQAIEINPNHAEAYNDRAVLYKSKGETELALSDYNRAIEINPNHAVLHYNRGLLYKSRGETELFLTDLNRVLELNPKDAVAYVNRGLIHANRGKLELALADFNSSLELNPKDAVAYINRGLIYQTQSKDELAWEDYNKAIAINPNNSAAYRNRGVLYFEQSRYELAKADWDKAIALDPQDAQAYYNRGLLYLELSDNSSAKTDLETAQKLAESQDSTDLAQKAADALRQLSR